MEIKYIESYFAENTWTDLLMNDSNYFSTNVTRTLVYETLLYNCCLRFFSLRHFGHLDISVIRLTVVLKVAITVFISQYFQTSWLKWLNVFRLFQKYFGLWPKKNRLLPGESYNDKTSMYKKNKIAVFFRNICKRALN